MNNKLNTFILISVIAISLFTNSSSFALSISADEKINLIQNDNPKYFQVFLQDSISILDNDNKNDNGPKSFNVYLIDNMGIDDNSIPQILSIVKIQSDNKTMLERIWNYNLLSSTIDAFAETLPMNDELVINSNSIISQVNFNELLIPIQAIENNYLSSDEYPTLFLLLAPFAGFVLLSKNNFKIKQTSSKQFSSYVLIFVLLSSATLAPVSIGSSYWGYAFAEEMVAPELTEEELEQVISEMMEEQVQTEAAIESTNSTSAEVETVDTGLNATSTEPIVLVNATSTEPIVLVNATSTEPIVLVNATSTEPIDVVNATSTEPIDVVNATSTEPIDVVNATSTEPIDVVNATSTEPISTPTAR